VQHVLAGFVEYPTEGHRDLFKMRCDAVPLLRWKGTEKMVLVRVVEYRHDRYFLLRSLTRILPLLASACHSKPASHSAMMPARAAATAAEAISPVSAYGASARASTADKTSQQSTSAARSTSNRRCIPPASASNLPSHDCNQ
jgi:hypothetical protein